MEKITLENYVISIIDNPKETLSKQERNELVQACIPVARKGFNHDGITASDIEIHALDVTTGIYIADKAGKVIGFGGTIPEIVDNKIILHLKGTAIMPEHQSKGLYHLITPLRVLRESEKQNADSFYIGTRTQNPRVFEFMCRLLNFYPQPELTTPDNIKSIAEAYAKIVQDKHSDFHPKNGIIFDKNHLIVRRAYGGVNIEGQEFGFCMYGDNIPKARDERINLYAANSLDFKNGDALILVGQYLDKKKYLDVLKSASSMDYEGKMYGRFAK